MTSTLVLVAFVGLAAWAIAAYAIWYYGPGLRRRSVQCPLLKRRVQVVADQREADFGSLKVVDITFCSVFDGQPDTCGKECLYRL
jgi:hypothetical protein